MKLRSHIGYSGIVAIAIFIALGNTSCLKRGRAYGSFFIKGHVMADSTGAPVKDLDVYVEYVYNASYLGGSYERGKAGSGLTDSAGNFLFECQLYNGVDYTIKPWSYYVPTPGSKDTFDMGVLER